jgi:monoamine oxidase
MKSFRMSKYRPQMGHVVKYLARVDGRFWIQEGKAPSAADTRLGIVWESTDTQNYQGINDRELVVFAGGPLARTKGLRAGSAATYFRKGLAGLYSGFRSQLTGEIVRNWPDNTLIRGGYSCPKPGDVRTALKNMSKLAGRLVFAGEHASPAFFGFMEGAIESGLHAAHLIFKAMNVTPLPKTGAQPATPHPQPVPQSLSKRRT